ncbi:MAG: cupin domain-containing protein [Saprospiraceae bacterium]|nr:cupin domain-containing protein [Saprospiraceae bacterium]
MSKSMIKDAAIEWEDLGGGVHRKVMAYNDDIMLVKVSFKSGGVGALHHHPHIQVSYVESGVFKLKIGEEVSILHAGDAFLVSKNIIHGAECLESGILIDVFNPCREDFIKN